MYLNCHTGLSLKYGTLPIKALFEEARRCGVHKLALTEINNVASYIELLRICNENSEYANGLTRYGKIPYHLDLVVGIEFRSNDNQLLYIALAKNNEGFEKLNRLLSHHHQHEKDFPERAPEMENVLFIYPFRKMFPEHLRPDEFIGVRVPETHAYVSNYSETGYRDKFVALHPVTLLPPLPVVDQKTGGKKIVHRDFNAHRLLRAIANNTLLSKLAEHQQASPDEFMVTGTILEKKFEDVPELLTNAKKILDQCSLDMPLGIDKNKKHFLGSATEDMASLRKKTWDGYQQIYGDQDDDKKIWNDRIEKELTIIAQKKFTSYYLITDDLINYAKSQSFDFVGRGSGANSTVAYCLGITNVDPIELDLYFERFLNEERASPPDFDIDFSWDNRDAIYEYLFQKYSADHVCLLGTHVTYQSKSIIRELAKVFGLPKEEIDALVEGRKKNVQRDHIAEKVLAYAGYIVQKELPSNFSIHAGGVLITEKPIYHYTAVEFPPKSLPVSQFEMHAAEDLGIYKFDILSQRGLGHIKETVRHVKQNRGIDVDVHQFRKFKHDEKIKHLMRSGNTVGCFYVESPATRMLLGKLRCDDYLTLVAASSIIRPGVASSGMMKTYIERFHIVRNGGTYQSIHPVMDEIMHDTYGVMVYQEDVIRVAHYFAGLSLTEADVLRRGMSGKYRSREEFQRVKDRFFAGCHARGYDPKVTDRVWFEIESFAGYSFAKGHSASYAVESYQSLFLKAHYPLEFMVGVINNFGGFYQTEFYFHEAQMNGAEVALPCVNKSQHLTTIEGRQIYIGFVHLKSLEKKVAQQIARERERNGTYKSLSHFLTRVNLGLEQVRILIRIGAFRFTGKDKQHLLWEAMLYFSEVNVRIPTTAQLFDREEQEYPMPVLKRDAVEDTFDEIELLGFTVGDPFCLLTSRDYGDTKAPELTDTVGKTVTIVGYLITTKDTRTKSGQYMHFGTFYDCDGRIFDTVHFPDVASRFPFRGRGFYKIKGKVIEEFGVSVVEVSWMDKLSLINKKQLPAERFRENTPAG